MYIYTWLSLRQVERAKHSEFCFLVVERWQKTKRDILRIVLLTDWLQQESVFADITQRVSTIWWVHNDVIPNTQAALLIIAAWTLMIHLHLPLNAIGHSSDYVMKSASDLKTTSAFVSTKRFKFAYVARSFHSPNREYVRRFEVRITPKDACGNLTVNLEFDRLATAPTKKNLCYFSISLIVISVDFMVTLRMQLRQRKKHPSCDL